MPHNRIASAGVERPAGSPVWAASALSIVVAIWAVPASARSVPDLERLDLTVRPTDVAAPPRSALDEPPPPFADNPTEPPANPVEEIDKVERNLTPNRLPTTLGPLGGLGGEEGGVLQELLENKTIPLFRVRMKSPL
jgi:hypothetical protein